MFDSSFDFSIFFGLLGFEFDFIMFFDVFVLLCELMNVIVCMLVVVDNLVLW